LERAKLCQRLSKLQLVSVERVRNTSKSLNYATKTRLASYFSVRVVNTREPTVTRISRAVKAGAPFHFRGDT